MIVFLNLDGTARIVSPERVFQGSSVNIVSAIYAGATNTPLQIAFTLPNKVVTQYAPMSYNVASQEEIAGVWEYKIPRTVTEKVGTVGMTICATLPNGKQTSYNLTFNVEYAVLPTLPPAPAPNVYDLILQYLSENQSQIVNLEGRVQELEDATAQSCKFTQSQLDAINSGITEELVGQISQNKTDIEQLFVIPDKNLYNLGRFDTYTSNGNGTGTVSRKTGYFVINSENITELVTSPSTGIVTCKTNINLGFNYPFMEFDPTNPRGIASNGFLVWQLGPNYTANNSVDFYLGSVHIRKNGLDLDGYRNLCPIYVQYIIAEQYQYEEQVIENQPIHSLNQQGEAWLDKEFRKGLNVADTLNGYLQYTNRNSTLTLTNTGFNVRTTGLGNGVIIPTHCNAGSTYSVLLGNEDFSKILDIRYYPTKQDIANGINYYTFPKQKHSTFIPTASNGYFRIFAANDVTLNEQVMINEGTIPYNFEPYYGEIVRVRDLDLIPIPPAVGEGVIRFDETSPASYYANTTWEKTAQGRMLVGANDMFPTGSEDGEVTHTLTIAEMPQHTHGLAQGATGVSADGDICQRGYSDPLKTINVNATGSSQPHNNMPPYLAVNYWKRIS